MAKKIEGLSELLSLPDYKNFSDERLREIAEKTVKLITSDFDNHLEDIPEELKDYLSIRTDFVLKYLRANRWRNLQKVLWEINTLFLYVILNLEEQWLVWQEIKPPVLKKMVQGYSKSLKESVR